MNKDPKDNPGRSRWRPGAVYICLITIAIPWYWPEGNHVIVFGMPGWVIVAIAVSIVVSLFTAWLLWPAWPEESSEAERERQNPTSKIR